MFLFVTVCVFLVVFGGLMRCLYRSLRAMSKVLGGRTRRWWVVLTGAEGGAYDVAVVWEG